MPEDVGRSLKTKCRLGGFLERKRKKQRNHKRRSEVMYDSGGVERREGSLWKKGDVCIVDKRLCERSQSQSESKRENLLALKARQMCHVQPLPVKHI